MIGTTDTPVMPQLAREALRVKGICVSLEWCVIDSAALWQFVNNGALLYVQVFQCERLQPRQPACEETSH